jgi:DnaA family protein
MQQLPLGVRIPDRAVFESFFGGPNAQAVEYAMRVAAGGGAVPEVAAPLPGSAAARAGSAGAAGSAMASGAAGTTGAAADVGLRQAPVSAPLSTPGAAGAGREVGTQAVTWLCGPTSVGKTHLLQAIVARAGKRGPAGYFPLMELAPLGVGVLEGLTSLNCICLDDLDPVVGQLDWETALFGLLREIQERDGSLIVSAKAPPALLPWSLRDLGSRFAAAAIFQLHELDEDDQQKALQLHAHVRGFELPDDTARWLQRRFPRDMRTLYNLLDTLDEAALVAQRRLTVPFIRSVLKEPDLKD